MVIRCDEWETVGDGAHACRLWRERNLLWEVRPAYNPSDLPQHHVSGTILLHQRFKRTSTLLVFVRIGRPWGIKPCRPLMLLDVGNLVWFDEQKHRLRVDKAPDQPRRCQSIHPNRLARHPFHNIL